jgi:ribose transport system substrate-binding protein
MGLKANVTFNIFVALGGKQMANRVFGKCFKGMAAGAAAALLLMAAGCSKPAQEVPATPATKTPAAAPAKTRAVAPAKTAAAPGAKRKIRIGMVVKCETNDVFQAAKSGAFDAAKELGPKYGVEVAIDWRTPTNEDAAKQADFVNALANEKVDAILVSCSEAQTMTGAINDAVDKGVIVACVDSDAPQSKRLFDYGTDDEQFGRQIIDLLAKEMGDKGTIAILDGNESGPNLQLRLKGGREELKKYPNMHELNGNGVFYHQETPEKASEALNAAMAANPGKINGWAIMGGWPLFTDNALNFAPGAVKVVCGDALPKQLNYLRDGHVQVLLSQDCYGWGYKGVQYLLDYLVKGIKPASKIPNPLTVVTNRPTDATSQNVNDFAKYWDKWLKK